MTCKTCKHRKDRECEVLNDLFLVMCRTDNYRNVLDKKILIKDKTLDNFSCSMYSKINKH